MTNERFVAMTKARAMARGELKQFVDDVLARAIAQAVVAIVSEATAPLLARIAALEAAASALAFKGQWTESGKYRRGNIVTQGGAIYYCSVDGAESRPGVGGDWALMIPKPRDGKDAPTVPAEPPARATRSNR